MVSGVFMEENKPLLLLVFNLACSFFFFPSQGAEGEMVFPTEEMPFKSDNTTELFNSGQPLACSRGFGARPQRGV